MKCLTLLLSGAIFCGMLLGTTEIQAQNRDADWGAFGLQLGLGIADAAIRSANQNNNRWGNQPTESYNRPYRSPGASGSDVFGRYTDPFNQQNNNWNRPSNNWNQNYQYAQPRTYTPSRTYNSSDYYESVPVAPKVYSKKPIVINCPEWCVGICQYSLISASGKEYVYSITPGEKQEFKETTDWKIKYDRGGGRGYKTYRLHGGKEYELHGDGDGEWAFYASPGT